DYGLLGVNLEPTPRGKGARLTNVSASSPAAKAGLQAGDLIVKVDGKDIHHNDDLFLALGMAQAGETVKLEVARSVGGVIEQKETKATLAKFLVSGKIIARNRPSFRGLRVDYTSLLVQEPGFLRAMPPGVWVREVKPRSRAAAYFKTGDIITRVNDETIS